MEDKYILLNLRDELYRVKLSTIVCFEAQGNYTSFVLRNKLKGTVCVNLGRVRDMLVKDLGSDASMFIRIGRRYIINREYIYNIQIAKHRLVLSDGATFAFQLTVSGVALRQLKDVLVSGLTAAARK